MTKLRAVLRRRWLVLVFGIFVGAVAGVFSAATAPEAGETSYRVNQLIVANRAAGTQGLVDQDALRVTRGEVAQRAAATLGIDDPQDASSGVSATASQDSGSIEVSVTDPDPEEATRRAEAFVGAFLEVVNADLQAEQNARFEELQGQIDSANQALDAFDEQYPSLDLGATNGDEVLLQQLVAQRGALEAEVQQVEDQLRQERLNARSTLPYSTLGADAPQAVDSDLLPVPTSAPFRAGLLGVFGLALAAGAVMIIERMVPRIDTRSELVAVADYPVLSEVGHFPSKQQPTASDGTLALEGPWAEAYRRIRSAIQFVQARAEAAEDRDPQNVFLITSTSPSDGKSTTCALTGIALAETGQLTLVVGGDFRRPHVHELLGAPSHPGIRDFAQIAMERPTAAQVVKQTRYANLHVAPAGAGGKEIAGLPGATKEICAQAVDQGATVVIDSSPLEVANDTIDLLPAVDQVIVLVRSGHTAVRTLEHSLEALEQHGASVMGLVLIGAPGLGKRQYYYEGYYTPSEAADESWPQTSPPHDQGEPPRSEGPQQGGSPHGGATPPPFVPGRTPESTGSNESASEDRDALHAPTPRWAPSPGPAGPSLGHGGPGQHG